MPRGTKYDLQSTCRSSAKFSMPGGRQGPGNKFAIGLEKSSSDSALGIDIEKRGFSIMVKQVKDGAVKEWNAKNPFKSVKVNDFIVSVNGQGGTAADMWDQLKEAEGRVEVIVQRTPEAAPGPGKYGAPSVEEKFKKQPSFSFGSGGRSYQQEFNKDERRGRIPGPGSYGIAFDPNSTSSSGFGFGSAARIPVKKEMQKPDPGKYHNPRSTSLLQRNISLGGKRSGARSHSVPGPGAYKPSFNPVETNFGQAILNTTEDREKAAAAPDAFRATLPGPGTYEPLKELGGNIVTQMSPNYGMGAKRRPLRPTQEDVNFHISHYTTFG